MCAGTQSAKHCHGDACFFGHFGRRLVEEAELTLGARMLDVATGRGAPLCAASAVVGPSGQVIGIDIAARMLAATRAEAAAHGLTNVELRQMDAEGLAFLNASFDVVLCGFALFLFPGIELTLAEIRRVLRPGGQLAVSTWVQWCGPEFAWLEPLQAQFLPSAQTPSRTEAGETPVVDTPEGLTALLINAGFTDVAIVPEIAQFVYADEETWWQSLWSHGMRGWREAVERQQGAAALQRFKQAAFTQLHTQRRPDGYHQTSSALFGTATKPAERRENL